MVHLLTHGPHQTPFFAALADDVKANRSPSLVDVFVVAFDCDQLASDCFDKRTYAVDDKLCMSQITGLSSNGLPPSLGVGVQGSKSTAGSSHVPSTAASSQSQSSRFPASNSTVDSMELSQFAILLSGLRTLHQTDPTAFTALLSELGANLSHSAQAASSEGNVGALTISALEGDFAESGGGLAKPARDFTSSR